MKRKLRNKYFCGDCEQILKEFPSESIDFIITSPPYSDQRIYSIEDPSMPKFIHPDDYINWFLPKAEEMWRVLKPTGSLVLNINDKTVDHFQHLYVFRLLLRLVDDIGFHLVRDYIWFNPATPPNAFSKGTLGRTKKSHEYCFWLSKGDKWTFNMDSIRRPYSDAMKIYLSGQGKGNRVHNTRPSTYSFDCEKVWENKGGSDPGSVLDIRFLPDEILEEYISYPGDVLPISNTGSKASMKKLYSKGIKHPARFPEKLIEFFVLAGTNEGDLVCDPFMGSGTTAVVAERLKRDWVGIDVSKDYIELAKERLDEERKSNELKNGRLV